MSDVSTWCLQQNSALQSDLDRVTDLAIEKITAKKITPERDQRGSHPDRARLQLSRADASDQSSIEALFAKLPIRVSGMELLYDRTPDFFALLRARGHASAVLTARQGSSRDLWGLGSVSLRQGYFGGAESRVAYLGDLRMLLSRSTARVWRQLYNQLLKDISKELHVSGFLTSIVGDNTGALRSLVTRRNNEFIYEPLGRLRLLGILGRFSLLANGRRKLDEKRVLVGETAEAEFARFYSDRARGMRHGWKDVPKAGVPIVIKNRHGDTKIVARLVSPDALKRMRIQSIEWKTRLLFQSLRATGVHPVAAGSSVTTTYLSWVCFGSEMTAVEKRHALIEMIDVCLEDQRLKEMGLMNWMLFVPDTIGLSVRELGGRFHYSTPVELFEVRPESAGVPTDLKSQILQDVGFEMSLI